MAATPVAVLPDAANRARVRSALAARPFNPLSPLLSPATPNGTTTSHFCSPDQGLGGRYTSYRGHWGPVGEMAIDQSGILSVGGGGNMPGRSGGGGSVKLANRRGMALWSVE